MGQLITIKEAARVLGIESRAVKREGNRLWELIHGGKIDLPYIRLGRRLMFDPSDIEAWLRKAKGRNGGQPQAGR